MPPPHAGPRDKKASTKAAAKKAKAAAAGEDWGAQPSGILGLFGGLGGAYDVNFS